ncbi:hypothetical protein D3C71_2053210 [compost metagenome]
MRTCNRCQGSGEIDTSENEDGSHTGDCWMCEGSGEVEDGCYCMARTPFECGCGGWNDVDLDDYVDY